MDDVKKVLGDRIRSSRIQRCITREELASMAGLTPHYIYLIERGSGVNPNLKSVQKIASALEVRVAYLLGSSEAIAEASSDADVGAKIHKLRMQQKIFAKILAKEASITPLTLLNAEKGLHSPTIGTLEKIASALGVPVWSLFKEDVIEEINSELLSMTEEEQLEILQIIRRRNKND